MAIDMTNDKRQTTYNAGFTIFFAMLIGSLALAIGVAIFDLTIRELDLSQTATQSQYAIYAADTGAECALYWDFKCTFGTCQAGSAFATSSEMVYPPDGSGLTCNGIDITGAANRVVIKQLGAGAATTTFNITFAPQSYCVKVQVEKSGNPTQTVITARGYNAACPPTVVGSTRLERVLQVTY